MAVCTYALNTRLYNALVVSKFAFCKQACAKAVAAACSSPVFRALPLLARCLAVTAYVVFADLACLCRPGVSRCACIGLGRPTSRQYWQNSRQDLAYHRAHLETASSFETMGLSSSSMYQLTDRLVSGGL